MEEQMIETVVERCAGMDVGKKFVLVCVMTGAAKDEPQTKTKKFGTIVSELEQGSRACSGTECEYLLGRSGCQLSGGR